MRKALLLVLLAASSLSYAQEPAIIPRPVSASWQEGSFSLNPNTVLVIQNAEAHATDFFNSYLQQIYGFRLRVKHAGDAGSVSSSAQAGSNYILLNTLPASTRPVYHHPS